MLNNNENQSGKEDTAVNSVVTPSTTDNVVNQFNQPNKQTTTNNTVNQVNQNNNTDNNVNKQQTVNITYNQLEEYVKKVVANVQLSDEATKVLSTLPEDERENIKQLGLTPENIIKYVNFQDKKKKELETKNKYDIIVSRLPEEYKSLPAELNLDYKALEKLATKLKVNIDFDSKKDTKDEFVNSNEPLQRLQPRQKIEPVEKEVYKTMSSTEKYQKIFNVIK